MHVKVKACYCIVGNFQGRKLSQILRFCGYSSQNLGAWHALVQQKQAICKNFLCENEFSPSKVSRYTVYHTGW